MNNEQSIENAFDHEIKKKQSEILLIEKTLISNLKAKEKLKEILFQRLTFNFNKKSKKRKMKESNQK
jgi:hypothetical protein